MTTHTMTSHERFTRIYAHQEADRVPIIDQPWWTTVRRWHEEGMPDGADFKEFFGLDLVTMIGFDESPRFAEETLEETAEYAIRRTRWGMITKEFKDAVTTPEAIDFTIKDGESWRAAKAQMTPTPDRIDWAHLEANYAKWRNEGYWIEGGIWHGFQPFSDCMGVENFLMLLLEDPELCQDMFEHTLNQNLALMDMIWEKGYHFDCLLWADDLGYKQKMFFSLGTFRELLRPVYQRAVDWAHARGVKTRLHSCGYVAPLIPDLIEIGIDCLNPLEVKAGMDPFALKAAYGDRLVFHGGLNAVLWDDFDAIAEEMRQIIPAMKQGGGYVCASDHSIPPSVSLENFRKIVELAKVLGSYA